MVNLAVNDVACECGSTRLAPNGDIQPGGVCICASCARVFRVTVALTPIRWSELESALCDHPHDLMAFEWTRAAVPPSRRETLSELPLARAGRFRAAERSAVVLCLAFVLVVGLVIARAVFS